MKVKLTKPMMPVQEGLVRISAMAWSPNNMRLAVAIGGGPDAPAPVIHLFDENGERRDKFATKANSDKVRVRTLFVVYGMAFYYGRNIPLILKLQCIHDLLS